MDLKEIKQIVDLMKRSALTEFEIEEKDFKLRICRKNGDYQIVSAPGSVSAAPVAYSAEHHPAAAPASIPVAPAPVDESKLIKSPMVGTFYSSPNPDSPVFVQNGDSVNAETTVCIIEAMKVMNEIKAELSGTIVEILVQNGESVEYGQPLFRIR